ncbi:MAG: hypothetical protein WBW84_02040 [Acidobacteriaceae bacterium]
MAACVFASHPLVQMGFDDDFSYIWSARVLADTGHIVYNGWAAAMLGWQLYWGALFIRLFGFSFPIVNVSILLVAMVAAALVQRIYVRLGSNEWNATIATLAVVLSPLFLPLSFSYMSDIPGFFAILVCLYGCVRALQAESDRATIGWLIFAGVSNAIGGTARQLSWFGVLLMVPCTVWIIRRRRGAVTIGTAIWLSSIIFIFFCTQWFKHQPYAISLSLLPRAHHFAFHSWLAILLYVLPVTIGFLARYPIRKRWARIQGAIAAGALAIWALSLVLSHRSWRWLAPFSRDWLTDSGLHRSTILGENPRVFPLWLEVVTTAVTFAAFLAFLICFFNAQRMKEREEPAGRYKVSDQTLIVMLGPFTAAYLVLIGTRFAVYDRYFIPVIFVAFIVLLRFYERRIAARLPMWSIACVILGAVVAVCTLHDYIAAERASLAAANELQAAGIPRKLISARFEYDGWSQLQLAGRLNVRFVAASNLGVDPHTVIPSDADQTVENKGPLARCLPWFASLFPAVHARYQFSYSRSTCLDESQFPPFEYDTWLPPHRRKIYILSTQQ